MLIEEKCQFAVHISKFNIKFTFNGRQTAAAKCIEILKLWHF